jgi:hypothetical protein
MHQVPCNLLNLFHHIRNSAHRPLTECVAAEAGVDVSDRVWDLALEVPSARGGLKGYGTVS